MKTLKLFLFLLQSIFLGLLVAAGYILWQADFDPQKIASYMPKVQDKVKTAPIRALTHGPYSYADAVKSSSASVVTIYTSKKIKQKIHPLLEDPVFSQLFGDQIKKLKREKTETNLGSGVIMTHSGYIITNQHVIDGADEILISLPDGRSSEAELIGQDRESDIAVLHTPLNSLQNIQIANDKDKVQVGDIALAIGNPLNVGQTVTMGIISATGRNRVGLNTFENFIQTDAAINPGNSGGALINAKGDLIGINTAIFSQSGGSQGIGFAIPATLAVSIMQEIIETGKVSRGWLGVEGTEITAKAAMASGNPNIRGVLVVGVFIDSPADLAGVQTGDIITAINNQEVYKVRNVLENIAGHKPGDHITISLLRNGEPLDLNLITTERPQ
ncbi:MAG: PDZ domain-containing protein [Gammaproteobacteria bacterium]|nr:PDZ domain-containing protein [Gammaproteobacteria bacterium]